MNQHDDYRINPWEMLSFTTVAVSSITSVLTYRFTSAFCTKAMVGMPVQYRAALCKHTKLRNLQHALSGQRAQINQLNVFAKFQLIWLTVDLNRKN